MLLLPILFLNGCISRQEIRANLWLNSGLPADLCMRVPELQKYGMYRKLNTGKYELQKYCNPQAQHYFAVLDTDLNAILDALLPKEK